MRLNCVILNYCDAGRVAGLVRRIHDYDMVDRIVVVDNASPDGSWEELAPLADGKVSLVRSEENGGYGAGNNLGVRFAVGQNGATHVLIANPDVTFSGECLLQMLRVFRNHPGTGVVAASIHDARYPDMPGGWPLRGFTGELLSMGPVSRRLFRRFLEYPPRYFKGRKAVRVDVVHGSMLMVDAARFLAAGGYDENIFLYQEEAVLARRMKASGCRTVLLLDRSYGHEHAASITKTFAGDLKRQRLREGSTLYYMKHYLSANRLQEAFARLWFWGIRMEIRAAGWIRGTGWISGRRRRNKDS